LAAGGARAAGGGTNEADRTDSELAAAADRELSEKAAGVGLHRSKNLVIEYRFTEGRDDQYPAFAAELAALPVELIVTWGTPAVFAAKHATTKIPIVFVAGDAVNTGIVSNLRTQKETLPASLR
jgi:ABC-type uncharacterized transport system substrate-binding protein